MIFDLNRHFTIYGNNSFYDQKSYTDLKNDVSNFASFLTNCSDQKFIGLKIKSPYLAFVAHLSCLVQNKTAVFLSHLETESAVLSLKQQVPFTTVIEDFHFANQMSASAGPYPDCFEAIAAVVFTSGSSKAPKGVALSFSNLYYSAKGFSEFFVQTQHDVSLINLPHHHVGGLLVLWRAFFSGGSVAVDLKGRIDFISLVPVQLKRMLEDPKKIEMLKKIRVILIGGSTLTETLKEQAELLQLTLYETYGMSETTSLVMINGETLPYRELKLDEEGFFLVKGKTLALGYFEGGVFSPFKDSWFKTPDLGSQTADKRFRFLKRNDLVFISGGENINPLQIEEAARTHSQMIDAYVVPIQDEFWGEMGMMLYEGNVSESELKQFLKTILHPHLIPKFFFSTRLHLEGQLKPKRSELKRLANVQYLKSIFSHRFIQHADPSAELVVFFHGFLGEALDLFEIASPLSEKFSLLFIDLPGHGATSLSPFYSRPDLFKKLADFIELFSSTPIFYGYSMGGRVALHLSLNYLSPVHLILESAGLGLEDEREKKNRLKADLDLFNKVEQSHLSHFLKQWYSNPMFKQYTQLKSFKEDLSKKASHDFLQWEKCLSYLSVGNFPTKSKTLEALKLAAFPLTYIYGEEDHKYNLAATDLSVCQLDDCEIWPIAGAGHNPHKTHPLEIKRILINLLKL